MGEAAPLTLFTDQSTCISQYLLLLLHKTTRKILTCGSTFCVFTVATVFVCPASVCIQALVLISQTYKTVIKRNTECMVDQSGFHKLVLSSVFDYNNITRV